MLNRVPMLRDSAVARGVTASMMLALLVSGCASMAPRYEAPPLPIPSSWPADAASNKPSIARTTSTGWHDYFVDPVLRDLISRALENNRDLRTAILRVEEARAAYRIRRADQYPDIGLDADASRGRITGAGGQSLVTSQYQSGLGVGAWELDFWGRIRSLRDAALEDYLATDSAQHAVRLALIAQVANGYLSLRELDERVALAQATIDSRQESFRIFNRRFEVGAISRLDLTQVQVLLTQAQSLGAQLEQARASQRHALTELIGTPVDVPTVGRWFEQASMLADLRPGLPSELLIDRPDIIAAEHRLRASHADIGAARAAFFPRITLTGFLGSASADLDGLFDSGSQAWTFAPRISLPVFDGGRNRAGLDLANVRRDMAVADYEKSVQVAFREVSDALSARHWLGEQVRIQEATLTSQRERARLATLRYDNGATPYLEVLDAQRDLLTAEQQLVQTRRAARANDIALYVALGGGVLIESPPVPASAAAIH